MKFFFVCACVCVCFFVPRTRRLRGWILRCRSGPSLGEKSKLH